MPVAGALALPLLTAHPVHPKQADIVPLRVLIVGGGPDMENNQVAIESNVRYVGKLLPQGTTCTRLFADGNPNHATVLYDDDSSDISDGERILELLFRDSDAENVSHYRKPNLGGQLDGASRQTDIGKAFTQIRQEAETAAMPRSLLLYFTGHGSSDKADYQNNVYDLWGKSEALSVRELARHIERLPANTPITLVMVQCFSGAFGNVIFEGGDPQGRWTDHAIAGFFAAVNNRMAAGCTSAINEAEYRDFTSYFFAALTGRDRVGRRVTGADYNGDGRVGMDEAFCYTLANDQSIDVPVCTSDVFLRRFVPHKDSELFRTRYRDVRSWATPAQRAALDRLTADLHCSGEDRLARAYRKMVEQENAESQHDASYRTAERRVETLREEDRRVVLRRWPDLRASETPEYRAAWKEAAAQLTRQAGEGPWKDLLAADDALDKADQEEEGREVAQSRLIRFVRLGKSVILAHRLQTDGEPEVKARFARLIEAEGRTLLPPADSFQSASRP
jgi:hypothetical protein